MKRTFLIVFLCVIANVFYGANFYSTRTVFVWGDSHATPICQLPNSKEVVTGARTMHRVGRDGFNLTGIPFKDGDAALFSFGHIDVGWHICKEKHLSSRGIDEIVNTLVVNYLNVISDITKPYPNIIKIVYSVLPPSDQSGLTIRYEGTIKMRAKITKQMNELLRKLCPTYGIEFLDVYDDFRDENGILRREVRDPVSFFHIDLPYYDFVNSKLFEILKKYD